ncbi:MAG TPA: hypothetical protein ENG51_10440 [Deltaproteobacteria bacterium]|nr:hypothetical protein [Deltaproteobacteria bacterium]
MKKWMKILTGISFCVLSLGANSFAGFQVITSEGYHFVEVSLKDTNRIVCPVDVGNVIFSKEKKMQVKIIGRNAFVKFLPVRKIDAETGEEKLIYSKIPREAYIECGGRFFALVFVPKEKPAETIILRLPDYDKEKALKFEKATPYEKMLLSLIRAAYLEEPPEGYEVTEINTELKAYDKLKIIHRLDIKGARFVVHEFFLEAKKKVRLDESQFLDLVLHPLAICLSKMELQKGEVGRLFIVSLSKEGK